MHTKGPWFLATSRTGETFGAIYSGTELVATTGYQVRVGSTEDEDNARLIAAAPEMLEALKAVLTQIEALAPTLSTASYARAAIAKATQE